MVWVWQGEEIRVVSEASRRALRPTQLSIHRVPVGVVEGEADHHHVVARFGMSGAHRSNVPQTIHRSFDVTITVSGSTAQSVNGDCCKLIS